MRRPALPDLIAIGVASLLAFGAAVQLTQSDGDLFAHIAFGREIIASRQLPPTSVLGLAPLSAPLVAPAWGAATMFALLERVGGLAMVVTFTAALAGLTHGSLAGFLRRRGATAAFVLGTSLVGMVLVFSHWLARPHAFTLAFAALLVLVLEHDGRWTLPLVAALFVAWANLHGGWAFGLIVVGCYLAGAVGEYALSPTSIAATRSRRLLAILVIASLATVCSPYGIALHLAVLRTLTDPTVSGVVDEYRPPSLDNAGDIVFFCVLLTSLVLMVRTGRRPPIGWILIMLVCATFALRAGRNISLFGVTAWPLIAAHLAPDGARWLRNSAVARDLARYDAPLTRGPWTAASLSLLLLLGAFHGRLGSSAVVATAVDPSRFPVMSADLLRRDGRSSRMLTTWAWSGYIPYAWPGRRTFFDPLAFTPTTVESFGDMLTARADWRRRLDAERIDLVLVPRSLALTDSLRTDGMWEVWHEDPTAVVFSRHLAAGTRPK